MSKSIQIYKDFNGLMVYAVTEHPHNRNVAGHVYKVIAGNQITNIDFQDGSVKLNGVNGLTNEALLAITINRTQYLDGLFPCKENKEAIEHMQKALDLFEQRTKDRIARQVEGQYKV